MRLTGGVSRQLIRRAAGWIGADRNPLRRPVDRFEGGLRLVLLIGFLIAAPFIASAAGRVTHAAGLREVRQDASWRQVSAVLLRPAAPRSSAYGAMTTYWVPGRWRAPSGAARSGMVPAFAGAVKGDTVSVWVNRNGYFMGRRPMTTAMVQVRTVLAAIGSVAGLGVVLLVAAGLLRLLLNRKRLAWWGIEWACFGPRWSARRWPRS